MKPPFALRVAGILALELLREYIDRAVAVARDVADGVVAELLMLVVQMEVR